MNDMVAPVQDREVIFDGRGDPKMIPTTDWAALSTDTTGVSTDLAHILGTHSLEFDKVDGAANTVFGGLVNTEIVRNLSRFLDSDVLDVVFSLSTIADVEEVRVRLGTDASHYREWIIPDEDLKAGWNRKTLRLDDPLAVNTGNGWDQTNVKYAAFIVEFDAQDDTLADVLLDSIVLRSVPSELESGAGPVTITQLAAVGGSVESIDISNSRDVVAVISTVDDNGSYVTAGIEVSHDGGTKWGLVFLDGNTAAGVGAQLFGNNCKCTVDGTYVMHAKGVGGGAGCRARIAMVAEDGTSPTLDGTIAASK